MKTLLQIVILCLGVHSFAADTVRVYNVQQLLDSIRSNRVLLLESGRYDLSTHSNLVDISKENEAKELPVAAFVSYSSGDGITIRAVQNVKIEGTSRVAEDVMIVGGRLEDYVINVFNSSRISFHNITFTHDESVDGTISGGAVKIQHSNTIKFENCILTGRAANGLFCWRSKDIVMVNSTISNCSYGIVDLRDSWSLKFMNCNFLDNRTCQTAWYMSGCVDVKIKSCLFEGNHSRESHVCERTKMFSFVRCEMIEFNNNDLKGNEFALLGDAATEKVITATTDIKKNKFK